MAIIHTRVDSRLIHGQVASMWTNHLGATRIMVIDDQAASEETTKMSLKLATPYGVALSVLPVEKAAARIKAGAYEGQRVFLIVRSPDTLLELLKRGGNSGNQRWKYDARRGKNEDHKSNLCDGSGNQKHSQN